MPNELRFLARSAINASLAPRRRHLLHVANAEPPFCAPYRSLCRQFHYAEISQPIVKLLLRGDPAIIVRKSIRFLSQTAARLALYYRFTAQRDPRGRIPVANPKAVHAVR